jgi:membrane-bound lytic murein transglycosylase D
MEEPLPMTAACARRRRILCGLTAAGALLLAGCASVPTPTPNVAPPVPIHDVPPAVPALEPIPAPVVESPLEPIDAAARRAAMARQRLDPGVDSERTELWQRIRDGFAMPDLDHELVRKWEQHYASRPDYVTRMTERGARYLFHIVEEVDRRRLPLELALLPFIESAFNPQALSRAAASGMWQFMPATGRAFELRQNVFRDDRRDVLASTRAALDYLEQLHKRFGNWQLALAAYNWGQGNVSRAITVAQRRGTGVDYLSLVMPNETRDYVPKLQAMKNIMARPEAFGIVLPPLENHPYFMSVTIEHDIDAELAARLAGMSLEAFQQLNPQLNKPVLLAAGTPQILLPYDNANRFVRALAEHRGPRASWTAWRAPRTLKAAEAARLTGTTESLLREVNLIPARMLVKAGSILVVPRSAKARDNVAEHIAENGTLTLAPEPVAKGRKKAPVVAGKKSAPSKAAAKARDAPKRAQAARRGPAKS